MGTPGAGDPEALRAEEFPETDVVPQNGSDSDGEGNEPTVHPRRWVRVSGNVEADSSSEESDTGGQDASESVRMKILYRILKVYMFFLGEGKVWF